MSDKSPAPGAAGQAKTSTIVVQHGNREIPFRCFDNPVGKGAVKDIMGGEPYRWPADLPQPKTIVDVGACIGASALWFAMSFPGAKIHCFEPSPLCHLLLEHNLRSVPTASIEAYGLYDRDTTLPLFRGLEDPVTASLGASAANGQQLDQVSLRHALDALHELGVATIDCLKLNTCGSEVPILEAMIHRVPQIAVVFAAYYSEGDRRRIEVIMAQHHMLVGGRIAGPHRGLLTFARRASYADPAKRDAAMVRMTARRGPAASDARQKAPAAT